MLLSAEESKLIADFKARGFRFEIGERIRVLTVHGMVCGVFRDLHEVAAYIRQTAPPTGTFS